MTTPGTDNPKLLDRVRKLLAKAEDDGVTTAEAEAFTERAAALMAKYGIDRARLGALHPGTDKPGNKIIDVPNPWAQVHAHLLASLAKAMNCECVLLTTDKPGSRVHLFGYESDLERTDVLYTSVLLQMATALRKAKMPPRSQVRSVRAWNRSFLLGYVSAVIARVQAAEDQARNVAAGEDEASGGPSTALVLADRSLQVRRQYKEAYPQTRKLRMTYTGRGYSDGHAEGQRANIGGTGVRGGQRQQLTGRQR